MPDQEKAKSPYVGFSSRLAALFCDFVVIVFVATALRDHILRPAAIEVGDHGLVVFPVMLLYVASSWMSPLNATPFQFLFGMRVVDPDGRGLAPGKAILRGVAMTLLFVGTFQLLRPPPTIVYTSISLAALTLASLAIVTPRRQAAHDLLAKSIVVRRRALRDEQPLIDQALSWYQAGSDLVAVALLAFVFWNVAGMQHHRDMIARTNYAYYETNGLRTAIAFFYEEESRWPEHEMELGARTRGDYPDGGYYQMEGNGVVRIRFEVLPELTSGSLVLTPFVDEKGFSWKCHVDGRIKRRYLPGICRDRPD